MITRGSITHLTNASGNVIERYIYECRNRAYHPGLGRFMSEDPKGFVRRAGLAKAADDWSFEKHPNETEFNLFRYCGNDPLNVVDPDGTYGLAGFSQSERAKIEQAQKEAADTAEKAADTIEQMLKQGGQKLEDFGKGAEKIMGPGSGTPQNLSRIARIARKMVTALRDNGSKGYWANPIHGWQVNAARWPSGTFGRGQVTTPNFIGKKVWINTDHRLFGDHRALASDIGHESAHNAGIEDQAYKHTPEYRTLTPEQRLNNADSYMDLFMNGQ